jgi:hypothetical protein
MMRFMSDADRPDVGEAFGETIQGLRHLAEAAKASAADQIDGVLDQAGALVARLRGDVSGVDAAAAGASIELVAGDAASPSISVSANASISLTASASAMLKVETTLVAAGVVLPAGGGAVVPVASRTDALLAEILLAVQAGPARRATPMEVAVLLTQIAALVAAIFTMLIAKGVI